MQIAVPSESLPSERRVALIPDAAKKLVRAGLDVHIESGAGLRSGYADADYEAVGAHLQNDQTALLASADLVLRVRKPSLDDVAKLKSGAIHVSYLDPYNEAGLVDALAAANITAISMEMIPRTTRAQKMDALSSQANLAGYVMVILAAQQLDRILQMMMTPAGTLSPARVFVIGAGVAGLQAIATAKRLGAVIEASDVRPSVKEQIESLGGKFIDVPFETDEEREAAEGVGGYAKPMPPSWLARQRAEVAKRIALADVVISTALIPGRPAPELISAEMVASMKPGAVIVDIAADTIDDATTKSSLPSPK